MAEKDKEDKKPEFVVTDRRPFSTDGELRRDVVEDEERRAERDRETREAQQRTNDERAAQQQPVPPASPPAAATPEELEMQAPSEAEQQASVDAYKASTEQIDQRIEKEMRKQGEPHRAQDFEMTFE